MQLPSLGACGTSARCSPASSCSRWAAEIESDTESSMLIVNGRSNGATHQVSFLSAMAPRLHSVAPQYHAAFRVRWSAR